MIAKMLASFLSNLLLQRGLGKGVEGRKIDPNPEFINPLTPGGNKKVAHT